MPRLRDLGIVIGSHATGPHNTITDVPGVRVGYTTLIEGDAVRTGVTAVHPHEGSVFREQVPAAVFVLNGAGEITGRASIDEYGLLESPILLTNTSSVGVVHQAVTDWLGEREGLGDDFALPVVSETCDVFLNDMAGQHVRREHVFAALDSAAGGPVAEGNVGGGTGMALFRFKGGTGTASRRVRVGGPDGVEGTVGVLAQGNFGKREHLLVGGRPIGRAWIEDQPVRGAPPPPVERDGSVVVILATDIPLSDRQLKRVAQRGALGIARTGGIGAHTSGDLLLAFSNAPAVRVPRRPPLVPGQTVPTLLATPRIHDAHIDPVFEAAIEATEEAILNALVAAETMVGRGGNTLFGISRDRLRAMFAS